MNCLLINPTPAGDDTFADRYDHHLAMTEYTLDSTIQNLEDAVKDPRNVKELQKRYSELCQMHARMGMALHKIWRGK